jgi:glyoxylase-like metal-dependent hydrolase (beta-lactamase superfamily II)
MTQQLPMYASVEVGASLGHGAVEIDADLLYLRLAIVNVVMFGPRSGDDRNWVLIDAGIPGSRGAIERAAAAGFGPGARPSAIVLTHGHFDHVGALEELVDAWDVPVYAHPREHPYLDGTRPYDPPDPSMRDGLMSLLSPLYRRQPVNVSGRLRPLPPDGGVPGMPGWVWIETPGRTPGHVSLWHEDSRTLLAGDAVITTAQESAYEVALQIPEIHGPPRYFTPDWDGAERSVARLSALHPKTLVSGTVRPWLARRCGRDSSGLLENSGT